MGNKIPNWKKTVLIAANLPLESSIFEFKCKTLFGEAFDFASLKGVDALLITNVASKCGLTARQYTELVEIEAEIKQKLPEKKFQIIGFPCGQFSNQEFDEPEKIAEFVKKFNVDFPLMEKTLVNGDDAHPIFKFLKLHAPGMHTISKDSVALSPIEWNFGKFLLDKDGHVVKYFGSKVPPKDCLQDILNVITNS